MRHFKIEYLNPFSVDWIGTTVSIVGVNVQKSLAFMVQQFAKQHYDSRRNKAEATKHSFEVWFAKQRAEGNFRISEVAKLDRTISYKGLLEVSEQN